MKYLEMRAEKVGGLWYYTDILIYLFWFYAVIATDGHGPYQLYSRDEYDKTRYGSIYIQFRTKHK